MEPERKTQRMKARAKQYPCKDTNGREMKGREEAPHHNRKDVDGFWSALTCSKPNQNGRNKGNLQLGCTSNPTHKPKKKKSTHARAAAHTPWLRLLCTFCSATWPDPTVSVVHPKTQAQRQEDEHNKPVATRRHPKTWP